LIPEQFVSATALMWITLLIAHSASALSPEKSRSWVNFPMS
jgi:hypothetical protein